MAGKDTFIQHRKLDGCRYACETKTGANNVDFIPAEYSPHPTPLSGGWIQQNGIPPNNRFIRI